MREKAMREVILAQLGALRADAGVEQVACKDECVGDYLTGKADALAVAMQMVQSKALIETMSRFLRHETTRKWRAGMTLPSGILLTPAQGLRELTSDPRLRMRGAQCRVHGAVQQHGLKQASWHRFPLKFRRFLPVL